MRLNSEQCPILTCSDPVDIETLRRAAASKGGLLTDELRRKVWPKLLSINVFELPHKPGESLTDINIYWY